MYRPLHGAMVPTTLIFGSSYGVGDKKQHCVMFVGCSCLFVCFLIKKTKWSNGTRYTSIFSLGELAYLRSSVERFGANTCP